MKRFLFLLLVAMMVFGSLIGCTPSVPTPPTVPVDPTLPSDTPEYGGTARIALSDPPSMVWNIAYTTAAVDNQVARQIHTFLMIQEPSGEWSPLLASSWEFSSDNRTVTFNLRDDAFFHDGQPVTAEDVEFSFLVLADPGYGGPRSAWVNFIQGYDEYRAGTVTDLVGIKVLDAHTISFTSKTVNPMMLDNLGAMGILPKHILSEVPVADLANHPYTNSPIGAGPFKFDTFARDQHVVVTAFEDYFEGRPYLDSLVFLIRNRETALIEMEMGAVDHLITLPRNIELIEEWDQVNIEIAITNSNNYLFFNDLDTRFDALTRQAIAHALDRQGMIQDSYSGVGQISDTPIPSHNWAHHDGIAPYDYNPDKARNLLADAGWLPGADGILTRDGTKLEIEFLITSGVTDEGIAYVLKQNLDAVGFKVNIAVIEFPLWLSARFRARPQPYGPDDFDLTLMSIGSTADPDRSALFYPGGANHSTNVFTNERSNQLLEAGLQTLNMDERKQIYREWQELFYEELPAVIIRANASVFVTSNRVQNVEISWLGGHYYAYRWWIPKSLQ